MRSVHAKQRRDVRNCTGEPISVTMHVYVTSRMVPRLCNFDKSRTIVHGKGQAQALSGSGYLYSDKVYAALRCKQVENFDSPWSLYYLQEPFLTLLSRAKLGVGAAIVQSNVRAQPGPCERFRTRLRPGPVPCACALR